jgi:hypothetical protein
LKHGISSGDAIEAATWAVWIEDLDEESPARQLRLGFDTRARLLETVVLVFDSGDELVIHAMRARPQMFDLLP